MKKTIFAIALLIFAGVYLQCSEQKEETAPITKSAKLTGSDKTDDVKTVTVPFKATFTVQRQFPFGTGECELGYARETMVLKGNGNMAHLGKLKSIYMTFCVYVELPNDPKFLSYKHVEPGKFVAANGDELYFTGQGQVIPYPGDVQNQKYQAHFDDEIIFIGGTGKFEGATGSAKTNAFVHSGTTTNDGDDPFYTDFFITEGSLTLPKGKHE